MYDVCITYVYYNIMDRNRHNQTTPHGEEEGGIIMSIGVLTSSRGFSSLAYTGSPVTDRFTATTEGQELILFRPKDYVEGENDKIARCNSVLIEADGVDLYLTVVRGDIKDIENFDFTGEPVYYVPAGESRNISGLAIQGIKLSNALGARYFIEALSY
jgi:hypothetical protein